jgi:hypothetical protein
MWQAASKVSVSTHIIQAMKESADATSMAVGEAVTEHRSHRWYTGRCEPVGLLEPILQPNAQTANG